MWTESWWFCSPFWAPDRSFLRLVDLHWGITIWEEQGRVKSSLLCLLQALLWWKRKEGAVSSPSHYSAPACTDIPLCGSFDPRNDHSLCLKGCCNGEECRNTLCTFHAHMGSVGWQVDVLLWGKRKLKIVWAEMALYSWKRDFGSSIPCWRSCIIIWCSEYSYYFGKASSEVCFFLLIFFFKYLLFVQSLVFTQTKFW